LELYLYHEQNETKIQDFKKSYTDGGEEDEYDIFPPDEELCRSFSEKINNLLEKPCYKVDESYDKNQENSNSQYRMLLQALVLLLQTPNKNTKAVLKIYEKTWIIL